MYEYGVMMRGAEYDGLHRGPLTKEQAESFVKEWEDDIKPSQERARGLFYVVRRPVGEWERV